MDRGNNWNRQVLQAWMSRPECSMALLPSIVAERRRRRLARNYLKDMRRQLPQKLPVGITNATSKRPPSKRSRRPRCSKLRVRAHRGSEPRKRGAAQVASRSSRSEAEGRDRHEHCDPSARSADAEGMAGGRPGSLSSQRRWLLEPVQLRAVERRHRATDMLQRRYDQRGADGSWRRRRAPYAKGLHPGKYNGSGVMRKTLPDFGVRR